jgi:hypothetical protein
LVAEVRFGGTAMFGPAAELLEVQFGRGRDHRRVSRSGGRFGFFEEHVEERIV